MDDYITVVEVDDPTSKDTNSMQQLVKRQSSIPEDSSFITVLTINNNSSNNNNNNNNNNNSKSYLNSNNCINESKDAKTPEEEYETNSNVDLAYTPTNEQCVLSSFSQHNNTQQNGNGNNNSKTKTFKSSPELETVVVFRLPGERLGFGLKFQGGTRSTEKVQKLYIQSCANDSPASRVATSWGILREGDEIVSIDGQMVSDMTRIECVRGLKDNVAIKLEVRNGHGNKPVTTEEELCEEQRIHAIDNSSGGGGSGAIAGGVLVGLGGINVGDSDSTSVNNGTSSFFVGVGNTNPSTMVFNSQTPPPPPPVPPRKLIKRDSLKELPFSMTEVAPNSLDSNSNWNVANKAFTPPPDAEYYINLFADRHSLKTESESDDTASTISTIIDKFSLNSNYSSDNDLSSYASMTNGGGGGGASTDLTKVLKPFTMLEQEFKLASSAYKPSNTTIPGNNYENVELKTEKINAYENIEFAASGDGSTIKPTDLEAIATTFPTPKPRQANSNGIAGTPTTSTVTMATATIEPKKRSILPMPRKLAGSPMKLPIEVAPPKVPDMSNFDKAATTSFDDTTTPTNEFKEVPSTPQTPTSTSTTTPAPIPIPIPTVTASPPSSKNPTTTTPSKEFITKIPKAIASVLSPSSQLKMERSKTESDIKLNARQTAPTHMATRMPTTLNLLIQQTAAFLENENKASAHQKPRNEPHSQKQQQQQPNSLSTKTAASLTPIAARSRIPVVASTPKRPADHETISRHTSSIEKKQQQQQPQTTSSAAFHHASSPSNIPRMLMQKQKSETDLKLGHYRSKSSEIESPVPQVKIPLMRTISAESKLRTPERTLIPVLSNSTMTSSTESLSTSSTISNATSNGKTKGPKPKPPERVQSLAKQSPTHIPKLAGTPSILTFHQQQQQMQMQMQMQQHQHQHHYTPTQIPTMQTFKQSTTTAATTSTATSPAKMSITTTNATSQSSPHGGIRFKIQTYESKVQANTNSVEQNAPLTSAFTDANGNESETMPSLFDLMQTGRQQNDESQTVQTPIKINVIQHMIDDDVPMLDRETPPPMVVGKCIKLNDDGQQATYYSSSSSEDDGDDGEQSVDEIGNVYECEEGEKLGPPEIVNGPGPSEAYFNVYWHANMLPTIGEVAEEDLSSLEQQSLSNANGSIVVTVDDLSQQKPPTKSPTTVPVQVSEKAVKATTSGKFKKSQFIGVPVLPPTIPNIELEKNLQQTTAATTVTLTENSSTTNTTTDINGNSNDSNNINAGQQQEGEYLNVDMQNDVVKSAVRDAAAASENDSKTSKPGQEIEQLLIEKTPTPIDEARLVAATKNEQLNGNSTDNQKNVRLKSQTTTLLTKKISNKSETEEQQQTNATEMATVTKRKSEKSVTEEEEEEEEQQEQEEKEEECAYEGNENKGVTKHIKKTTKKMIIKTTKSTISSSSSYITNEDIHIQPNLIDDEQFDKLFTENICGDLQAEKISDKLNSSSNVDATSPTISFNLKPYTERHPENSKITIMEECNFETAEQAFMQIRTRNTDGDEQVHKSTETHREHAKFKKVHCTDDELLNEEKSIPLTITAATETTETRIRELVKDPQDKQSIEGGILHLSESGKQFQCNEDGVLVGIIECDHQVLDTYDDVKQHKLGNDDEIVEPKPLKLMRDISECVTLTKDGEKQVTKRAETTMSEMPAKMTMTTPRTTPKKVATLLKKTEDEKRIEREARELIENYQKVKKEAEKLYQYDEEKRFVDDGNGFELDDIESTILTAASSVSASIPKVTVANTINEFLAAERERALKPIDTNCLQQQQKQQPQNQQIEKATARNRNNLPPALPTSAIPDLLMETEPLYVLHKNIIDETAPPPPPSPSTSTSPTPTIGMGLSVTMPQQQCDHSAVTNESQKQPPQRQRQYQPQQSNSKAPFPLPILTKNAATSSSSTVCNFDSVDHAAKSMTHPIEIHSPVEPIDERIIVGVEHQLELPVKMTAPTTIKAIDLPAKCVGGSNAAIATTVNDLSSATSIVSSDYNISGSMPTANPTTPTQTQTPTPAARGNSLYLESINLPNFIAPTSKAPTPIQTPTIMSTSSSAESVQSVVKISPTSLDNIELLATDEQEVQHKSKMDDNGTLLVLQPVPTTTTTSTAPTHVATPPPAYSRLPPDGHEFPPNFCEPVDIGAIFLKSQLIKQNGNNLSNSNNKTEAEIDIHMAKKNSVYSMNNNNEIVTTTTATATTTTSTIASINKNKNATKDNLIGPVSMPPPLPKTVPPLPVTKPRKIFREKLVVNIEDARIASEEAGNVKNTPAKIPTAAVVMQRRSSSTQSLSTLTTTTPPTSSGSSTPTANKLDQPEFQLRETHSKRPWTARKPSDWHKDEKSERSVRDKIAMFSMDDNGGTITGSTPHLNFNSGSGIGSGNGNCSRKPFNWSSENLLETNSSNIYGNSSDGSSNSANSHEISSPSTCDNSAAIISKPSGGDYFGRASNDIFAARALSMENLNSSDVGGTQEQHQQLSKYSESLQSLDTMHNYYASLPRRHVVHPPQIERRTSFSGGHLSEEASRKVANLLEHRRRSITKLRGLVIPERPSTLEPILDLPEIKSRDSEQTNISDYSTDSGVMSGGSVGSNSNSKSNVMGHLAVHNSSAMATPRAAKPCTTLVDTANTSNSSTGYRSIFSQQRRAIEMPQQPPQPPAKPPRTSLATLSTVPTTLGSTRPPVLMQNDESDSDSVFSSKVSSPPMSPMGSSATNQATTTQVVPEKFALTRTLSSETNTSIASSTTSTLTSGSGSQASCSSVGSTPTVDLSRRIVKSTHSASSSANGEVNAAAAAAAASRKNILASAKCRSGRGESSLLRQRSQVPYHDDEDSTDGYDEEEVRRVAHKTRSRSNLTNGNVANATSSYQGNASSGIPSKHGPPKALSTMPPASSAATSTMVNYKLVQKNGAPNASSIVDRVINVAAYVEVTTTASDTDDSSHKSDATNATSPSKISAIFIDEERKASFKAPTVDASSEFELKAIPHALKSLTSSGPAANIKIANAVPVRTVTSHQTSTSTASQLMSPLSSRSPLDTPVPPPKKRTSDSNSGTVSSEMQQWVQSEMAKSSSRAVSNNNGNHVTKSSTTGHERSLKPVLAKFERTSNKGGSGTGNSSSNGGISSTSTVSSSVVISKHHTKPITSTAELRERFERSAANASASKVHPTKLNTTSTSTSVGAANNSYLDRFSSLDSVASSSSGVSSSTQNVSSTHEHNDFGSFSSLGSNQSLITAQDLWQIMEEADPPLKHREAFIVVLQRDTPESTVGITLAGGADYETKEVTVNKVLAESPAARDGRLRKGDRILAVNGMSMRGLTHNESVSVLKTPRPEVTLVVTRSESLVIETAPKKRYTLGSMTSLLEKPNTDQQLEKKQRKSYHSASRSLDIGLDSVATINESTHDKEETNTQRTTSSSASSTSSKDGVASNAKLDESPNAPMTSSSTLSATERKVIVSKDYCGLGFSLEGGFDSPLGNRPLLIRKVFYGGAAHKTGQVRPGDEILAINGLSTAKMTRIEVWNYMNQLPMGDVELVLL